MLEKIFKREIADEIEKYLGTDNIVVLHGARQVGKTYILYYLQNLLKAKNELTCYFDLEDSRFVEILDEGVESLLSYLADTGFDLDSLKKQDKKLYVFIDEIQYLSHPSPLLKLLADHHKYLQLIVSGSSSFDIKSKFSDSLVGRTVNFEIFNLSFREFLTFKEINYDLASIGSRIYLERTKKLYEEYLLYGGYPKVVLTDDLLMKEKHLQQIVDTYVKKDIRDLANIKDTKKFNNLLKVLASQSGNLLNVAELSDICTLAKQTVENYLFILENTYVIKLVPPYSTSAKVEVVKAPKIFFYDTGLMQILWLKSLQKTVLGNIFETSVFAQLVKKYGADNINYWRTRNQTEIDFILMQKDKILPIEVKYSFRNVRKSALHSFCRKYKVDDYQVVGLTGEKKDSREIYPWEV